MWRSYMGEIGVLWLHNKTELERPHHRSPFTLCPFFINNNQCSKTILYQRKKILLYRETLGLAAHQKFMHILHAVRQKQF